MTTSSMASSFRPIDFVRPLHPAIAAAHVSMDAAEIHRHPFFDLAVGRRDMLDLWVSQELFVTNPFAELLLDLARQLPNVHLRSLVVSVASGEHSTVRDGVANRSHPWLLWQLAERMKIAPSEAIELSGTAWFLQVLREQCARSTVAAVGALGVGNEALLVPEYGRMLEVFDLTATELDARSFLDANIQEDTSHAALMDQLASALLYDGAMESNYLSAAEAAVEARIKYYDMLARFAEQA